MASKQRTRYAILGLLTWKPMSGYDIKKVVDVGLSHFWNENYGQIYPTLDRLVQDGLATKKEDQASGKRMRFIYKITRKGKTAFRNWMQGQTDAPVVRNELLLKFFLSSSSPDNSAIDLIEDYHARQQAVLDDYRVSEQRLRKAIEDGCFPEELDEFLSITGSTAAQARKQLDSFYLTLRHGICIIEARLAWCEEVIAHFEK